jgi:hypothetical protein
MFISNSVTIAQTVSKVQHFFEIHDGGVRHVGSHEKLRSSKFALMLLPSETFLYLKFGDICSNGSHSEGFYRNLNVSKFVIVFTDSTSRNLS